MAKAFSVASWNVEHFSKRASVAKVIEFLRANDGGKKADIIAIYEVKGSIVYEEMVTQMPGYTFHITEGPQTQEILLGVKQGLTAFFTQRVEFKQENKWLRPGALLSVHVDGENYSVLFLHTKSTADPVGLGLRDEQFKKAFSLKRRLDEIASENQPEKRANFLFLGDLNTMGMEYPYQKGVEAEFEIKRLKGRAGYAKMRLLTKTHPNTWWNGPDGSYDPSDLDQVVASRHLEFKKFGDADVSVRGWPELSPESAQKTWIDKYSDHGLLYFEVQKV